MEISEKRARYIVKSNNRSNPNKNVCALAVAARFGVDENVDFLHTIHDLTGSFGHPMSRWQLSEDLTFVLCAEWNSVAEAVIQAKSWHSEAHFIVWVKDHVLHFEVKKEGRKWVAVFTDTDPRKSDRRKVNGIWKVTRKAA